MDLSKFIKENPENLTQLIKDNLDEKETMVISYRYGLVDGKNHDVAETAMYTGVSEARANSIEYFALKKLETAMSEGSDQRSIDEVGFSVRTYHALKFARINKVSDLVNLTMPELEKIRGIGEKSKQEILEKLREFYST